MAGTNFYRARLDIRDRLMFNFVTYQDNRYLLLLEVIKDHNYARSRFLNGGAVVNEDKLTPVESAAKEMENAAVELPYIYPEVKKIHTLNKFISFDQFQQSVYTMHPPLIIVGFHGMLFFLIVLLRNTTETAHSWVSKDDPVGFPVFSMDELVTLAELFPDEVLPPYRKKRAYINSIMALNEKSKDSPYCKEAFYRVQRGLYILNPEMITPDRTLS